MAVQKIDYLSRDYASLRASLLQYAQTVFPEWQPASEGDFGVMLVELFAYMGDIVSYYTDRAQFENYLPTATQRESILNLAFMLGYIPNSGSPSRGTVSLTTVPGSASTVVPAGLPITTNRVEALDGPVTFETEASVTLPVNPSAGPAPAPVTVNVVEGVTTQNLYLGPSTGLPGQVFPLPHAGVYGDTIRIYVEDLTGPIMITPAGGGTPVAVREWTQVTRLLGQDQSSRVFESRISSTVTNIFFGDDLSGDIPGTGLKVYATYRHGVGSLGNLAAGTLRLINTDGTAGMSAVRVAQDSTGAYLSSTTTGGADEESNQSIRVNAPRAFRSQGRIVTKEDFKSAALAVPGVRTANVVIGSFTSVTVFITGPGGTAPSNTLRTAVANSMLSKVLAGVTVTVSAPTFVPIDFGSVSSPIQIFVKPGYSVTSVDEAAKREIARMVVEMNAGEPLAVSSVYDILNNIDGVDLVNVTLFTRVGAGAQTTTAMITPQPWEIFTPGTITLNVS